MCFHRTLIQLDTSQGILQVLLAGFDGRNQIDENQIDEKLCSNMQLSFFLLVDIFLEFKIRNPLDYWRKGSLLACGFWWDPNMWIYLKKGRR